MKYPHVTSIDWLQLFCERSDTSMIDVSRSFVSDRQHPSGRHLEYYFLPAREFLHGYRYHYRVMTAKYEVAHIAYGPVDARVRPEAAAIKSSNSMLYYKYWRFMIEDVLHVLGWRALNITRLDLCCDFNKFDGGLTPQSFIRAYLYPATNKQVSFLRVGSNKAHIVLSKDMYNVDYQTLRWGSRSSGVSVYLYNKSEEMKSQKYKPYIVKLWEQNGLVTDNPKLPVYRLEFSINSKGTSLKDLELDECFNLWLQDFDDEAKVYDLFKCFAKKHFRFRKLSYKHGKLAKPDGSPARYVRDLPEIDLFRWDAAPVRPVSLYRPVDSGRTERLISKRLGVLADQLEDISLIDGSMSEAALKIRKTSDLFDEVAYIKSWERHLGVQLARPEASHLDDVYRRAITRLRDYERDRARWERDESESFVRKFKSRLKDRDAAHALHVLNNQSVRGGVNSPNYPPQTKEAGEEVFPL